jgi:hypothetical protein
MFAFSKWKYHEFFKTKIIIEALKFDFGFCFKAKKTDGIACNFTSYSPILFYLQILFLGLFAISKELFHVF